ncbi:MAG TPA: hypothetical protein V6C71_10350 [Coleofasciculaceae cyanobacterium]
MKFFSIAQLVCGIFSQTKKNNARGTISRNKDFGSPKDVRIEEELD